jgi:hypothetical protein
LQVRIILGVTPSAVLRIELRNRNRGAGSAIWPLSST